MLKTDDGMILWMVTLEEQASGEPDVALVVAKDEAEAIDLASKGPGVKSPDLWKDAEARPYRDKSAHVLTQYDSRFLPENIIEAARRGSEPWADYDLAEIAAESTETEA
jgi:hypothetical protein